MDIDVNQSFGGLYCMVGSLEIHSFVSGIAFRNVYTYMQFEQRLVGTIVLLSITREFSRALEAKKQAFIFISEVFLLLPTLHQVINYLHLLQCIIHCEEGKLKISFKTQLRPDEIQKVEDPGKSTPRHRNLSDFGTWKISLIHGRLC